MVYIIPVISYRNDEFYDSFKPNNAETYRKGIRLKEFSFNNVSQMPNSDVLFATVWKREDINERIKDIKTEFSGHGLIPTIGEPKQVSKSILVRDFGYPKHTLEDRKPKKVTKPKRKVCKCKK